MYIQKLFQAIHIYLLLQNYAMVHFYYLWIWIFLEKQQEADSLLESNRVIAYNLSYFFYSGGKKRFLGMHNKIPV